MQALSDCTPTLDLVIIDDNHAIIDDNHAIIGSNHAIIGEAAGFLLRCIRLIRCKMPAGDAAALYCSGCVLILSRHAERRAHTCRWCVCTCTLCVCTCTLCICTCMSASCGSAGKHMRNVRYTRHPVPSSPRLLLLSSRSALSCAPSSFASRALLPHFSLAAARSPY